MADLQNLTEIRAWLEAQPCDVISVFAARSVLRSVPHLEWLIGGPKLKEPFEAIVLPTLWAMATALSAGRWSDKTVDLKAAATAADTARAATAAAATHAAVTRAAANAAHAALAAFTHAARTTTHTAAAITATHAAAHSATAATATHAVSAARSVAFFRANSRDINFIDDGGTAQSLAEQPLWGGAENPLRFPDNPPLEKSWRILKTYLLGLEGQEWQVWTEWYEARLDGAPLIKDIEIGDLQNGVFGRVTFPEDDYKNPAILNPKIKAIIEAYHAREAALEQDKNVETFAVNQDGLIDRSTSQTSAELTDTPTQRDWYESLRQAALGLKDLGENALGRAARPVNNMIAALPEDIVDAKVARLWPAANRLRRLQSAHDKAVLSQDEYHPNRLAVDIIDDIEQFVAVYNNLVIGDENLAQADKRALGPQDVKEIVETNTLAAAVIKTAIEHDLFTQEAQAVVEDAVAEDAEIAAALGPDRSGKPDILAQMALEENQRIKENSIRALIARIRDSKEYGKVMTGDVMKGAKMAIGAGLVAYIAKAIPALLKLVMSLF